MNEIYKQTEEMSPDEKFDAVNNLKRNLEDNFVQLGQLLSEIKRSKIFKFKGYKTFKEFIEDEYNMAGSFASKLIGIYDLYIHELDMDEESLKSIGVDKLQMIKPIIKDTSYQETEEWINKAGNMATDDLREQIKEIKERKKLNEKSLKDVLVDQFKERMVTYFNCSQKELNFKLALYFQDEDLDAIKEVIKEKQRRFDENHSPNN